MQRQIRWLALVGTVLAWLPLIAPVLLTVAFVIIYGELHFDYLMPAELFAFTVVGGLLLLGVTLLERHGRGLVGGLLAGAAALLAASQGLAVATGLASGEHEPAGWRLVAVMTPYVLYVAVAVALAVVGVRLTRALFRRDREAN